MKIYGPYLRKDGRKHVVIIDDNGNKTTKSWPRMLMEKHLGRELLPHETVDHIDNDYTNDNIENLQILSLSDNVKKQHDSCRHEPYIKLVCKHCGCEFERRKAVEEYNRNKLNKDGPFCSKACVGKTHY